MRTVLVTGISTGIGKAIAEELLNNDFFVIGSVVKKKTLIILQIILKVNLNMLFLI